MLFTQISFSMARNKAFDEDEVLDKAVHLFSQKGFNGTSAQDLVDCLGISRSSLYGTYTDKRTLFVESLKRYREKTAGTLLSLLQSTDDAEAIIKQVFNTLIKDSIEDKLFSGCFMVNATVEMAPHDDEVSAIVNGNMQDVEEALFKAVRKGQQSGQFSTQHSARSLARFLFNTFSGIRVAAKSGTDKKVLDDVVKVALGALK